MKEKIKKYRKKHTLSQTIFWVYNCVLYKIRLKINREKYEIREPYRFDYNYQKKVPEEFVEKETKRVFIFGTIPFYDIGGGQRSSQFAKTFNKLGWEVFYIYGFKSSDSTVIYLEIPCVQHTYIKDTSPEILDEYVRKDDLFIFEAPFIDFLPFLKLAKKKKAKVVYENIDNWEAAELGQQIFSEEALQAFIKESDLLTCTAIPLKKQTEKYCQKYKINKEIMYNANAVDDELFNGRKNYLRPYDMVLGTKTLTYYGSLWGTWFNWDLLFEIAVNNPRISINLIGDYNCVSDIVNNAPRNIHFLGLKSQAELPAYLKYSDFAILPFFSDEIGKYVSPLKIFEYIAMNKKVISSRLPDIKDYPNVIYADNYEEWNKAINDEKEIDIDSAEKFTENNNWYQRSIMIINELYKKECSKCKERFYKNLSVVVLNYNNMNVIFRCIDTLLKFNRRYNYEIIVVDNNSIDGSYEKLLKQYKTNKNVIVTRNNKNGCSSGRNLGVQKSSKDFVIFLDSDEWITNDYWLDNYFDIVEKFGDKTVVGWGAGWFNCNKFAYHVVDSFEYRYLNPYCIATSDIGYLATCGFIINRKFFNDIGGFDINYDPTCYEDTDLSLNVRHNGGEIYYSKYLGVGHLPHQTTKSGTKDHDELIRKKGEYFIEKWSKKDESLITDHIR